MRKKFLSLLILLLITFNVFTALNLNTIMVSAVVEYPAIYIEPATIVDPTLTPGKNFTINVNVSNVTDLYGFDFFLNYTTAVLTATKITLGSFFPSNAKVWQKVINDALGYVRYMVCMPPGTPPGGGLNGSGTLAIITFTVDPYGASPLDSPLDLNNTLLGDSYAEYIAHDVYDGYFSNIPPLIHDVAVISVVPSAPVVFVGDSVDIDVVVENQGDVEESFTLNVYAGVNPIGNETATLAAGANQTYTFVWNTTDGGSFLIRVEVPAVSDEVYTADNVLEDGTVKVMKRPVADANGPYSGSEGTPITFDASGSTPNGGEIVLYEWDWNNDGTYDNSTTSPTISHTWTDDYAGTVGLRVTDDDGLNDTATTSVTVYNVAPTVEAGPDQAVYVNQTVNFTGNFTDPGLLDIYTIFWDFGDGSNARDTLTPTHNYSDVGVYTVILNVTDDDGGSGTDALNVTVSPVPVHDIAILNVVPPSILEVYVGDSVDIKVIVKNKGNVDESFTLNLYADVNRIGTETDTLAAGSEKMYNFTWNTAGVTLGKYTIRAEVPPVAGETETADNIVTTEWGIDIIPEFPTTIPLLLTLALLAVSTIVLKRRTDNNH